MRSFVGVLFFHLFFAEPRSTDIGFFLTNPYGLSMARVGPDTETHGAGRFSVRVASGPDS